MRPSGFLDVALHVLLPLFLGGGLYLFPVDSLLRHHGADALWAYAFLSMLLLIWEGRLHLFWIATAFLSSIGFECAQSTGMIAGTGDAFDVLAYALGFSIALAINLQHRRSQHQKTSL